jgi:hypothetical protein
LYRNREEIEHRRKWGSREATAGDYIGTNAPENKLM